MTAGRISPGPARDTDPSVVATARTVTARRTAYGRKARRGRQKGTPEALPRTS